MNMLQVHIVVSYCTSGFHLSSSPYIFDLKSLRLPADSNMKFLANLPTELLLEISDFLSFVTLPACRFAIIDSMRYLSDKSAGYHL